MIEKFCGKCKYVNTIVTKHRVQLVKIAVIGKE